MNHEIQELIKCAVEELEMPKSEIVVEIPGNQKFGDYSSPVAMTLAKQLGQSPLEIAEKIRNKIQENQPSYLQTISVALPGFLNFLLSDGYFSAEISKILKIGGKYCDNDLHIGQKVVVEHSSPNLFKPFHIGHLMNNAIGESIARLFAASGADVVHVSYPSDISLGIGKAVHTILDSGGLAHLQEMSNEEQVKFFGECYARGVEHYETYPADAEKMRDLTNTLYQGVDGPALRLYEHAKQVNLDYFKKITGKLGSSFDDLIFESEAGKVGKELVRKNLGNVFQESNGAIIYDGESRGLHTRVFQNSDGHPTYEAKDLGLLAIKWERYNPDLSVTVVDYEQGEYFRVVLDAAQQITPQWGAGTVPVLHGRLSFNNQKLSSRSGDVTLASDVIETVLGEVRHRSVRNYEKGDLETIALSAIKYTILKTSLPKNVAFDMDKALSFEGDSGPYLLYTIARINSLITASEFDGTEFKKPGEIYPFLRVVTIAPEIIRRATIEMSPHYLVSFLTELAGEFNSFYESKKIIGGDSEQWDIACANVACSILEKGLFLLGIESVREM